MQFKREDLGLYFATALIGGGLGLLAGAFLTTRINKKREEDFNAADAARDESEEEYTDYYKTEVVGVRPELAEASQTIKEEVKKVEVLLENSTRGKIPGKQIEKHRMSREERIELQRLTKEYVVGDLQIKLVQEGTMTVEELEDALVEEELDDQDLDISVVEIVDHVNRVDYSQQYRDGEKPDMAAYLEKPVNDLAPLEIDDLLVTVGERWEILLQPPEGKSPQQKRTVYFDPEDEGVFTKTKGGDMAPADLRVIASEEVRDIIMPWLLFETEIETIYLNDIRNKKTRWYEIVRMKEDDDDADY